jgi:hypothetical protein
MSPAVGKRRQIARKYKLCLTLRNAVVTIPAVLFNNKELSALFTEFVYVFVMIVSVYVFVMIVSVYVFVMIVSVYVFVMIVRVNCGHFPKQHLLVDLCNGGCVFSVRLSEYLMSLR